MYSAFYNLNGKVSLVFINEVHKIPRGKGSDNLLWNSINDYSLTVVIKKKNTAAILTGSGWLIKKKLLEESTNYIHTINMYFTLRHINKH